MTSPISTARVGFVALLFYYAFSGGFMWIGRFIWKDGSQVMGAVFFLIGLVFFLATVYHTLELLKYGDTHLRIDGAAWPGGKLKATLRAADRITGTRALAVKLECRHVYWRTDIDSSGRSISEDLVWSKETDFPLVNRLGKAECKIEFDIPEDAQLSSTSTIAGGGQSPGHYWQVHVHADVPGIDLMRSFLVKVGAPPTGTIRP